MLEMVRNSLFIVKGNWEFYLPKKGEKIMFSNIKKQIKELAKNAVFIAEKELGSGKGMQKKKMAIDYVLKNLPFPDFLKDIISIFLSGFIDDVIEISVKYMNTLSEEKGE